MGTRHMVAAAHYLAAQAGLAVLEAGGNAIDAGVAGGLTLNVVHSEFTHFAGVAPIMIYLAARDEVVTISGLGGWPRQARIESFIEDHAGRIPPGLLRTIVPGAPDAWLTALERYGSMTFGEVAAAAIGYARDGYPVSTLGSAVITAMADDYNRWPENARVFLPGGVPPQPGQRLVLSDLAATLQFLADEEAATRGSRGAGLRAARDAFYRGDIARQIATYHAANGGWLGEADLADFRVAVEPPVVTRFHDVEVYACGPWSQGPVLPQALNLLAGFDLAALGHNTTAYVHTLVEALKLVFADRERYYGDPRVVDVPLETLLSQDYAARRRRHIDATRAAPGMPPAGDVAAAGQAPRVPEATANWTEPPLDTSYVCAVDEAGNMFSATPSDGCFDGPMIPGTGLCPSARGSQSRTDPAHPACLAPGKRPRLTPNPAMAIRPGHWRMPFGTPGDDSQPQAMLQMLANMAVFGMPPQAAIDAPRFATFSFPRSFAPHDYFPGRMSLERRFDSAVGDGLAALGHDVTWWEAWEWRAGAVCAIVADSRSGMLEGAADRRRPGGVAGR